MTPRNKLGGESGDEVGENITLRSVSSKNNLLAFAINFFPFEKHTVTVTTSPAVNSTIVNNF